MSSVCELPGPSESNRLNKRAGNSKEGIHVREKARTEVSIRDPRVEFGCPKKIALIGPATARSMH